MHRADGSRALEGEPALPWGKWVDVKPDLPAVLARELAARAPGVVRMSPIVTDPYQPIERRYRVTRGCLDAMAGTGFVPMVLTRSTSVLDDLDRLRAFPRALVGMSVPTDDDAVRAAFEPRTEPVGARIEALRALHGAGLRTFAVIQPMLPMDPAALVEALAPWVHAVRVAPMYEKGRSASIYREIGREEAATEAWELRTFEALREGFRARSVPVTTREDLHEIL
jgi:DNA repair photolyase